MDNSRHISGNLLLVTASPERATRLTSLLREDDHAVNVVVAEEHVLPAIQQRPVDLVVLDLAALRDRGLPLLFALQQERLAGNPTIFALGVPALGDGLTYLAQGADEYCAAGDTAALRTAVLASLIKRGRYIPDPTTLARSVSEKQHAQAVIDVIVPAVVALSVERDFERLLETIVLEAKALSHADGGTLYLREGETLRFTIMRTNSIALALGGTTNVPIPYPPVPLRMPGGAPNLHNVASYSALTGVTVNTPDAYAAGEFDFSGTAAFDRLTSYRSTSFLTVPLKNATDEVIGVMQLINATDPRTGVVHAFAPDLQRLIEALARLAVVALEACQREQLLRKHIQELSIRIDEATQAQQVADITGSDYFQGLQSKLHTLRARRGK